MEEGRRFHDLAAASTGNERSPRVDRCVGGTGTVPSATGCRLNAGDDGLRQRLFVEGFRRRLAKYVGAVPCRQRNANTQIGTVSAQGPATNAGRGEAE